MKAYVVQAPRTGQVIECREPVLGEHDLLVKVMAAGVCGTDAHIYLGDYYSNLPLIPGHEFAGVVTGMGAKVTGFREGQRVAADPNIFCEKCAFCKENTQNFCEDFAAVGVTRDGAFAEYVAVPEACALDLGDLGFAEGALLEPLACVIYGQERARPRLGDSVLIFGCGPIGLLHLQVAKHNGAGSVTVVDLKEDRLSLAAALGAEVTLDATQPVEAALRRARPEGYDLVIDTTGVPRVIQDALTYVKNAGSLLVFGVAPQESKVEWNPYDIYRRDLKIIGSFALKKTLPRALSLVRGGAVDLQAVVGARITLAQLPEFMEQLALGRARLKTIVYPGSSAEA